MILNNYNDDQLDTCTGYNVIDDSKLNWKTKTFTTMYIIKIISDFQLKNKLNYSALLIIFKSLFNILLYSNMGYNKCIYLILNIVIFYRTAEPCQLFIR